LANKRDYYEVLGLGRHATADEIRKAYKKLARKFHPDFNPNDKNAEARFKEVSEAYAVLSNDEARKKYDTFGHQGPGGATGFDFSGFDFRNMRGGFSAGDQTFFGSFGDILSELLGGRGRRGEKRRGGFAGDPFAGFGFGGFAEAEPVGQDLRFRLPIDFTLAAQGGVTEIQIPRGGRTDSVKVRIPAGVDHGQSIRLKGQGESGPGNVKGDLLLEIEIRPHPIFRRDGLDLHAAVPVTIAEAVLGAQIRVPTLDGEATITIAAGTPSGQVLRLRGRGIHKADGGKGDLYVTVQIAVPKNVSDKSKALIQTFDKENPMNPRASLFR
jgi:DnaJ-class molecular chaperone